MTLAHETRGRGPRLVLVHGFSQNRDCWGRFGELLAIDHQTLLVDAPGHGESAHDAADLVEAGDLIGEVGGCGTYVGYSMGGRMVLHTALSRPDLVERLVLIGATAGIADLGERAARRRLDEQRAGQLLEQGLAAFLDDWLALPLFSGLTDEQHQRAARLRNRPGGLASSLRRCGTGAQEPLWDRLGELSMPVALVVGERDERFRAIAEAMADRMPRADVEVVAGAGHAAHLEAPEAAARLVAGGTPRRDGQ